MEPEGSLPQSQQPATCRSSGDKMQNDSSSSEGMIQNYSGVLQEI